MPGGETGDKHPPKMGWTPEWRVGIWGIYICRSTARRGCMKQADKGEVVKGLWWSRDLYPLRSSGRIFISHVAQSDLGFFDYTGSHVEKNVTKDSNSELQRPLGALRIPKGNLKLDPQEFSGFDSSSLSLHTPRSHSTPRLLKAPSGFLLAISTFAVGAAMALSILLQMIWGDQESKKKQSWEDLYPETSPIKAVHNQLTEDLDQRENKW